MTENHVFSFFHFSISCRRLEFYFPIRERPLEGESLMKVPRIAMGPTGTSTGQIRSKRKKRWTSQGLSSFPAGSAISLAAALAPWFKTVLDCAVGMKPKIPPPNLTPPTPEAAAET